MVIRRKGRIIPNHKHAERICTVKSGFVDKLIERIGRVGPEDVQTYLARLAREKGFLETIFNAIQEGVIVTDPTGRINYVNQSACALFGFSREDCMDRLISELWALIQQLPEYAGKTTLLVLPEFGRDMDGSTTNGFFNHRQNSESTRNTWMLALGDAVRGAQTIERPVEHIDLCPTLARHFEIKDLTLPGRALPGLWL